MGFFEKLKLLGVRDRQAKLAATVEKSPELYEVLDRLVSDAGFELLSKYGGEENNDAEWTDKMDFYESKDMDLTIFHGKDKVMILAYSLDRNKILAFKKTLAEYMEFKE